MDVATNYATTGCRILNFFSLSISLQRMTFITYLKITLVKGSKFSITVKHTFSSNLLVTFYSIW